MSIFRILLCGIAIGISCIANAQNKIPYEMLDSLSADIVRLQKTANGMQYIDADKNPFTIYFPEESFKVWSYNRLATSARWTNDNKEDVLELTENIDMSKASALLTGDEYKGVTYVIVYFPDSSIKTQITGEGIMRTENDDYIPFFCNYGKLDTNKKFYFDNLYSCLYRLITELKIEKGLMTRADAVQEETDWENMSNEAFVAAHPNSILAAQARMNIDQKNK